MPYNRPDEVGDMIVSEDSISDFPINNWNIPFALTKDYVQRLAKMWLDYAKQNMKLKEMVSDIVAKKLR